VVGVIAPVEGVHPAQIAVQLLHHGVLLAVAGLQITSTAAMVSPPPQWLANLEFLTSGLTSHSLLKSSPMLATLAGSR
jgi:hypothetical protein